MLQAIAFYMFAIFLVVSAVGVISARNPVHSVLLLIFGFFNAAGLFVLLGAEFIALILVIVYVGAVAVLFLFVVMMLDISFADLRRGAMRYVPAGVLTGGLLLAELCVLYKSWSLPKTAGAADDAAGQMSNTMKLGTLIYTDYLFAFQVAGLILLVAMIGAIVLTFRRRPDTRRQKIADQNARDPKDVMEIRKVATGAGAS
jgi:NADH-quinone oxidoreductase subunit J